MAKKSKKCKASVKADSEVVNQIVKMFAFKNNVESNQPLMDNLRGIVEEYHKMGLEADTAISLSFAADNSNYRVMVSVKKSY